MNPLVTIAIPTYQRFDFLKEAVNSAIQQTYSKIEILVGQDPTPQGLDRSILSWCQSLVEQYPQFRYQCNSHNLGLAGNWNALASAAKGEFIVIIGDDDRLLPDFTQKLVAQLQPQTQVAFSNHHIINSQGERLESESVKITNDYHRDRLPAGKVINSEAWVWQNAIPMSAALVRTRDVQRLQFKTDLNTPEIEFFIRLAQEGSEFVFLPDYLSEYRVHKLAATSSGLKVDRLVKYLLPVRVSPDIEPYKKALLSPMMITSVSRCLMQGEIDQSRELISSEYYPSSQMATNIRCIFQKFCAGLPGSMGGELYKLLAGLRSTRSSI